MHTWEGCVLGTPTHRDRAAEVAWEPAERGGVVTELGGMEEGEAQPQGGGGGGGGEAVVCQTRTARARCLLSPLLLACRPRGPRHVHGLGGSWPCHR